MASAGGRGDGSGGNERGIAVRAPEAVANGLEELGCYSGLYHASARVFAPANVDELREVLAWASARGCRVTFRAGGHSFDTQALNDDLVVSLARLDGIEIHRPTCTVTVGPGATWGAILARLSARGLVPAVTVTTAHAPAGGTLSGDCLSRFSPAYGKEGRWILHFDLLTVEGRLLRCSEPPAGSDPATWTLEQRAFFGVIGGLGYLGAVVSITYQVLEVADERVPIGVRTVVRKHTSFQTLAADLVPAAAKTYQEDSDPKDDSKLDAIYSALYTGDDGTAQCLLFTSTFTTTLDRRRMPLHQPNMGARPLVEWLMRIPFVAKLAWPFYFKVLYEDGEEYIDDLPGYTFFMDGNVRAKQLAKRLGFHLRTYQQTFIVPSAPGALGGWDQAKDDLVEWLEHAHAVFRAKGLCPTMNDVLFLPADDRFLLSATAELSGFAVSYAFEVSDEAVIDRVKATFSELADTLWDKFRGRVYLVKNVSARAETLQAMYGPSAVAFFALKRELDPRAVLRNDFLERTFGALLRQDPARELGGGLQAAAQ